MFSPPYNETSWHKGRGYFLAARVCTPSPQRSANQQSEWFTAIHWQPSERPPVFSRPLQVCILACSSSAGGEKKKGDVACICTSESVCWDFFFLYIHLTLLNPSASCSFNHMCKVIQLKTLLAHFDAGPAATLRALSPLCLVHLCACVYVRVCV